MRGVDHPEQNRERGFLDVACMLEALDDGSQIHTQIYHLAGPHDRTGNVEPPVADKRKEEEGSLAKLGGLVVLEEAADIVNE